MPSFGAVKVMQYPALIAGPTGMPVSAGQAGWNIDGDDFGSVFRGSRRVHVVDHFGVQAFNRATNTGAEQSVNDNVCGGYGGILRPTSPGCCGRSGIGHHHRAEVLALTAASPRSSFEGSEEENVGRSAAPEQVARNDEAVAAVISLAAKNDDVLVDESGKALRDEIGDAFAGILHQRGRRNSEALGGEPVNLIHLGCGGEFLMGQIPDGLNHPPAGDVQHLASDVIRGPSEAKNFTAAVILRMKEGVRPVSARLNSAGFF